MAEHTFSVNRMPEVVGHSNTYCIVDLHISGTRSVLEDMTVLVQLVPFSTSFVPELRW